MIKINTYLYLDGNINQNLSGNLSKSRPTCTYMAQVTNKRGPPEVDRTLGLEGRTGMAYWGDAKHEQVSSLSHEKVDPPPEGPKKRKN